MKILMIEDSPQVINSVLLCLKIGMSEAELVSTSEGHKGIELVRREFPDIILLDLGLPDMDGMEVINGIRRFSSVPIIVLTVRNSEVDLAQALEGGATDYITKPFRPLELLARIRAALRSQESYPPRTRTTLVVLGRVTIDYQSREVLCDGKPVHLTPNQYELLHCLLQNSPEIVQHEVLENRLWDDDTNRLASLKNCIWELRRKIDDKDGRMIVSVRGVGYKFNP
ncbi:response regulator transcription factor [Chloroflexota bacterium]